MPTTGPERHTLAAPTRHSELSAHLRSLAAKDHSDRISIGEIVLALDPRAQGASLLLLALPNVVPAPPGTSALFGLPLMWVAWQLMRGGATVLPALVASRTLARQRFADGVDRVVPWLDRAGTMLQPRLCALAGPASARWVGALCLLLSTMLALPIPLGNMLPAAAICMLALGLMARDGLWVLAGVAAGTLALVLGATVGYGIARVVLAATVG